MQCRVCLTPLYVPGAPLQMMGNMDLVMAGVIETCACVIAIHTEGYMRVNSNAEKVRAAPAVGNAAVRPGGAIMGR